jgi:hypothetical protein
VAPAAEAANPEQPDHLAAGFVLQHSIHPCPQGDPRTTGRLPVSAQQQDQSPARRGHSHQLSCMCDGGG